MGNYIVHKRRKIRDRVPEKSAIDAGRSDAIERMFARRREAERPEEDRRQAAKKVRALGRRMERRNAVIDWTSGRRRTAARVAGIVIISATAGLRTQSVSIKRPPNGARSQLWDVDIRFENEQDFAFHFDDPTIPAEIDAIHLMRYAAPRIAEEIFTGSATAGADDRNNKTVVQLAESYANKLPKRSSLGVDARHTLAAGIVSEFEETAELRFKYFHAELISMVDALMHHTRVSRRECESILSRIYTGLEAFRLEKAKPGRLEPPRLLKAS